MKIQYIAGNVDQIGNDLFARIACIGCAEKNKDRHDLKFTGYDDHYFYEVVNKDFRERTCEHCGTVWMYQWTHEGVVLQRK